MLTEADLDFHRDRDATLKLIDWFDIDRVRAAKTLVVGAGAIGNEVLKNLALLGIGNVYVIDRDTIEMSNLSRSILFREGNQGESKALTAARALKEINSSINVYWQHGDIASDLGEGLLRRMDVIIGCLDSVDARFLLNRLCWRAGRPWIDAGIGQLNGEVRVFCPPDGPCYECLFTDQHYNQLTMRKPCNAVARLSESRGRIPTTPTIASLVAAVQVQECLKLLDPGRWSGRTLSGRQFTFNGTVCETDIVRIPRREDCPAHSTIDPADIIEFKDVGVNATAAELLQKAESRLSTKVHLYLETEIAVERRCPNCGDSLSLLRPIFKVYREELTCRTCGRECNWETDLSTCHVLSTEKSEPALLESTLARLGVPKFGIVEARAADGSVRYLELTGDQASVLAAES